MYTDLEAFEVISQPHKRSIQFSEHVILYITITIWHAAHMLVVASYQPLNPTYDTVKKLPPTHIL